MSEPTTHRRRGRRRSPGQAGAGNDAGVPDGLPAGRVNPYLLEQRIRAGRFTSGQLDALANLLSGIQAWHAHELTKPGPVTCADYDRRDQAQAANWRSTVDYYERLLTTLRAHQLRDVEG